MDEVARRVAATRAPPRRLTKRGTTIPFDRAAEGGRGWHGSACVVEESRVVKRDGRHAVSKEPSSSRTAPAGTHHRPARQSIWHSQRPASRPWPRCSSRSIQASPSTTAAATDRWLDRTPRGWVSSIFAIQEPRDSNSQFVRPPVSLQARRRRTREMWHVSAMKTRPSSSLGHPTINRSSCGRRSAQSSERSKPICSIRSASSPPPGSSMKVPVNRTAQASTVS